MGEGKKGGEREMDRSLMGGGPESFLEEKHILVYFPSEGNSLCF